MVDRIAIEVDLGPADVRRVLSEKSTRGMWTCFLDGSRRNMEAGPCYRVQFSDEEQFRLETTAYARSILPREFVGKLTETPCGTLIEGQVTPGTWRSVGFRASAVGLFGTVLVLWALHPPSAFDLKFFGMFFGLLALLEKLLYHVSLPPLYS